jgi:F-type H+-transporting ATPase subunit epsilon
MARELTLRVITPDQIVLDTRATSVQVPASDGLLGILPRHAHLVAALDVGNLKYEHDGHTDTLFVSGGFVEVRDDTVRVVSEAGERPGEIDEERARLAEERARKRLAGEPGLEVGELDVARAELALKRAMHRLRTVGKLGS